MSEGSLDFISREELLGGGLAPGRQASTLLFAIESRTAYLVAHAKEETTWFRTQKLVEEREQSFLEALTLGRDLPSPPSIQEIERYALDWAGLVQSSDTGLRAAVAYVLGKKYEFTYQDVPGIRANVGLDDPAVQAAFERYYQEPLSSIYVEHIQWGDRVRWGAAAVSDRLEGLPPFWLAFLLTLPGASGLLALPIALAGVSLTTALILLVGFGILNMLTVAALAESTARSGTARFGLGFLGQLAQEYLGNTASGLLTVVLALNSFFVLIIFYVAVGGTLEGSTTLPTELWIVVLFAGCLYFLSRKSLNATVAVTLIIIFIILAIMLAIPLLTLPYFQAGNLEMASMATVGSELSSASTWAVLLGVMLTTFFSHLLIATYGPVVMRRDPSARTWIRGSTSAIFVHMLFACLWVIVINGALSSDVLASTTGTVLAPLGELVGSSINVLGSILVILSLGLASVQISLGLYYQVMEHMPEKSSTSIVGKLGDRGRFILAIVPVIGVFILAEIVAVTQTGSFAGMLGYVSGISLPILGGIFPVLVLAATRRKGDLVPGSVSRILGNPITLSLIFIVFLGAIFAYGFFIYDSLVERLIYVVFGIIVLVVTFITLRGGALKSRTVIELRGDYTPEEHHQFNVTSDGKPLITDVHLTFENSEVLVVAASERIVNFDNLLMFEVRLIPSDASELKVWAHKFTPRFTSEPLPASLLVKGGAAITRISLQDEGGQFLQPISGEEGCVKLTLSDRSTGGYVHQTTGAVFDLEKKFIKQ